MKTKSEKFVENFFKKKLGKKGFLEIKKKQLINDGIIDSLDIVILSVKIKKFFKISIEPNNESNFKIFNSYEKLISKIKNAK